MGGCCSSESDYGARHQKPTADLVTPAGELRQYPIPVTVAQVLLSETSSPDSFFVCNSDCLYFDDFIPPLHLEAELEPAQIYFVLPLSKLRYRLAASDMAALAVKASVALNASGRRRSRKARISPVLVEEEGRSSDDRIPINVRNVSKGSRSGVSRSNSMRKLRRYSSRRAKMAGRSFGIRLTTINEGSVLLS